MHFSKCTLEAGSNSRARQPITKRDEESKNVVSVKERERQNKFMKQPIASAFWQKSTWLHNLQISAKQKAFTSKTTRQRIFFPPQIVA